MSTVENGPCLTSCFPCFQSDEREEINKTDLAIKALWAAAAVGAVVAVAGLVLGSSVALGLGLGFTAVAVVASVIIYVVARCMKGETQDMLAQGLVAAARHTIKEIPADFAGFDKLQEDALGTLVQLERFQVPNVDQNHLLILFLISTKSYCGSRTSIPFSEYEEVCGLVHKYLQILVPYLEDAEVHPERYITTEEAKQRLLQRFSQHMQSFNQSS